MTSTPMLSDEQIDAERVAFEGWADAAFMRKTALDRTALGGYYSPALGWAWEAWQVRAILSAASVAAPAGEGEREELLGDAIRALIRGDITCSDDLPQDKRPVHVSARRAFGAVYDLLRQQRAASPAAPVPPAEPPYAKSFGYSLAMRVMQSDLYRQLDGQERAECDEMIRLGQSAAMPPADGEKEPSDGVAQLLIPAELLREARDTCQASIVEDGISAHRKEYRIGLYERLSAALSSPAAVMESAPAVTAAGRGEPVATVVIRDLPDDEFYWMDKGLLLNLPPGEYELCLATPPAGVQDERCPACIGAEFPGWKRGVRCTTCNGTATAPSGSAGATEGNADGAKGGDDGR